jgi:hypothetical protein
MHQVLFPSTRVKVTHSRELHQLHPCTQAVLISKQLPNYFLLMYTIPSHLRPEIKLTRFDFLFTNLYYLLIFMKFISILFCPLPSRENLTRFIPPLPPDSPSLALASSHISPRSRPRRDLIVGKRRRRYRLSVAPASSFSRPRLHNGCAHHLQG